MNRYQIEYMGEDGIGGNITVEFDTFAEAYEYAKFHCFEILKIYKD